MNGGLLFNLHTSDHPLTEKDLCICLSTSSATAWKACFTQSTTTWENA